MTTSLETTERLLPSLWREVCDKCGTRMDLKGWGYGFERWACLAVGPFSHQLRKTALRGFARRLDGPG